MQKALALLITAQFVLMPAVNWAQQSPPADTSASSTSAAPHLSQEDLEKLVEPIALYPDPMISLILPASAVPTDIVLAARFLRDNKDTSQIDAQNWDQSVKGLARYPDVLNMMNENLDWTNQLGAAVIAQQADVMAAIQSKRAKAHALGNLETTPQQKVVVEKDIIQVVPADPQVIYVPTYDPSVVYVQSPPPAVPFIAFGAGLALGAWIGGGCDWYHDGIYTNGCWGGGGWNNNNINIHNDININNNNWHPNHNRPQPRPPYNPNRPGGGGGGIPPFKPAPPGGWGGNHPGGNTPNNRPGGGGSGTWNGNGKPGGNGNRPANFTPGGSKGPNSNNRPGGGGSGTYKGGTKPTNFTPAESSHNSKKQVPNTQRPGADTPERQVPDFSGGNNHFQQHGSKLSGASRGNASRPASRPGGGGGRHRR